MDVSYSSKSPIASSSSSRCPSPGFLARIRERFRRVDVGGVSAVPSRLPDGLETELKADISGDERAGMEWRLSRAFSSVTGEGLTWAARRQELDFLYGAGGEFAVLHKPEMRYKLKWDAETVTHNGCSFVTRREAFADASQPLGWDIAKVKGVVRDRMVARGSASGVDLAVCVDDLTVSGLWVVLRQVEIEFQRGDRELFFDVASRIAALAGLEGRNGSEKGDVARKWGA